MAKSNGGFWWVRWCAVGSIAISVFLLGLAIFLLIIGITISLLVATLSLLAWHIALAFMLKNIDKDTDREIVFKLRWLVRKKK